MSDSFASIIINADNQPDDQPDQQSIETQYNNFAALTPATLPERYGLRDADKITAFVESHPNLSNAQIGLLYRPVTADADEARAIDQFLADHSPDPNADFDPADPPQSLLYIDQSKSLRHVIIKSSARLAFAELFRNFSRCYSPSLHFNNCFNMGIDLYNDEQLQLIIDNSRGLFNSKSPYLKGQPIRTLEDFWEHIKRSRLETAKVLRQNSRQTQKEFAAAYSEWQNECYSIKQIRDEKTQEINAAIHEKEKELTAITIEAQRLKAQHASKLSDIKILELELSSLKKEQRHIVDRYKAPAAPRKEDFADAAPEAPPSNSENESPPN